MEARWIAALVILGVTIRLVRYLLRFPLWEDEAFLAVNLLDTDYRRLLEPLGYVQVSPVLFLWIEWTLTRWLGFSEYSLRLFPVVSSVAGLFLFRHLAGRFLKGAPLVLAVGTCAVAYPAIRYAAEVKPYGSDMTVSAVLLILAVEWFRRPDRQRWLWALLAAAPLAVWLSYPAVFIAGGISLSIGFALLWSRATLQRPAISPAVTVHRDCPNSRGGDDVLKVVRRSALQFTTRSVVPHRAWIAWIAYNLVLATSFAALLVLSANRQNSAVAEGMSAHWKVGFPPLDAPWNLPLWLVLIHTSDLMAYPVGGEYGASTLTLVCCAVAVAWLWRRKRWPILLLCLAPLPLMFLAAALHRYPYGGHMRMSLHLAPIICSLAGLGASLAMVRWWGTKAGKAHSVALTLLSVLGITLIARDLWRPGKSWPDITRRESSRTFWTQLYQNGEVICLQPDPQQRFAAENAEKTSALYLCDRRIYSPPDAADRAPRLDRVTADRPLRCVRFCSPLLHYDEPAFADWLEAMNAQYQCIGFDQTEFDHHWLADGTVLYVNYVQVYSFIPRQSPSPEAASVAMSLAEERKRY